jgi:hypothetical protein
MEHMEPNVRFAFFYNTTFTFAELLDFICEELELPTKEAGRHHKIRAMNQLLIDQLAKAGTVVLLIDEAQNRFTANTGWAAASSVTLGKGCSVVWTSRRQRSMDPGTTLDSSLADIFA